MNAEETKTVVSRMRIVQRIKDGVIFGWTLDLDKKPTMCAGWKTEYSDGSTSIELDRATTTQLAQLSVSQREEQYIQTIANLRAEIAKLRGIETAMGGTPITHIQDPSEAITLTGEPIVEESFTFQPEDPPQDIETPIPPASDTETPVLTRRRRTKTEPEQLGI